MPHTEWQPSLTRAELRHWLALRRVSDGRVTRVGTRWLNCGAPVPEFITTLTELCEHELVTLADPDSAGVAQVTVTDTGADRFEQLCQQALGISAEQFMAFRWVPNSPGP